VRTTRFSGSFMWWASGWRRGAHGQAWTWWIVSAAVMLLLLGGIFLYPAFFVPSEQTAFGWFENDVYIGLLILAEYLCIQRLRNVTLTPGR
jgi:hypothetical protein